MLIASVTGSWENALLEPNKAEKLNMIQEIQLMKQQSMNPLSMALLSGVFAASIVAMSPVQAFEDPISVLPSDTELQFKYNNAETIVSAVGDELIGIVNVTTINDIANNTVEWVSGSSTQSQLTGIFDGLIVDSIVTVGGNTEIKFTGGELRIYNVADSTYAPTNPLDPIDAQICGGACPAPWLTFDFVPGYIAGDPTTTLFSTVSSITTPLTGTGDSFLKATGGTAASFFEGDFTLQSNLESCAPGAGGNCLGIGNWPIASFDPVIGRSVAVPEPSIIGLLSAGFLGIWMTSRRRRAKVA